MTDTVYVEGDKVSINDFQINKAWVEHKFLILFVLAFNLVGLTIITLQDPINLLAHAGKLFSYMSASLKFMFFGVMIFTLVHLVKVRPQSSPLRSVYNGLLQGPFSKDNICRCLIGYFCLVLCIPLFVKLKTLIPVFHPFAFDSLFQNLDMALHFGHQPWELLQSFLGHPWITLVIHRLYYAWFPAILITYYWQLSTRKDPVLRQQFMLSFIGCWVIIGTVLATALSSAGPIYYAEIVPSEADTYAKPMEYLMGIHEESTLIMLQIKELLWWAYTGELQDGKLRGISAMPSMHVSISFLLMLLGWRVNKWFGWLYTAFFVCIALGSVHLLWHYAVDGYVSIVATFLIWKAAGWFARKSVAAAEQIEQPSQTA